MLFVFAYSLSMGSFFSDSQTLTMLQLRLSWNPYIAQTGLKLVIILLPYSLTLLSTEITGVSHHVSLSFFFLVQCFIIHSRAKATVTTAQRHAAPYYRE